MAFKQGLQRGEGIYFVKAAEGLDSLRDELLIGPKADIAQNLRFDREVGAVYKRAPVSYFNTAEESNPPTSIYRYYREDNNTSYLIGLFGTSLKSSTTGTFSTIATLTGSTGKKFTAVTYNDLCIISTGYDNIIQTDGTVGWELGAMKAALASDATPAQIDAGVHYYAIVYETGAGDVVCGAHSNSVTNDATHTSNTLSFIPLGPDSTTARKIYRTVAGGSTLKLLDTISDNSTQTYTDIKADSALGADMGAVNSDMPKGLYLYLAQERLFVGNDPTGIVGRSSTVYYSDQYTPQFINTQSADLSTTDAASNYEVIFPNDNDVITGLFDQLGTTYVFKRNSIRPWDVTGTDDTWTVGNIVSTIGCPAPYTIQNTPGGIIYQGWDRMYVFNGQYSTNIIDDFSFDENFLDARRAENVGFFWNNIYFLAYTDANSGSSYCNRVLLYDLIRKQTSLDIGGALNSPAVPGDFMNVGCFTSLKGTGEWGQLYAGDSVLGWIYQYDRTISFNQVNTKTGFDLGTHSGTYASLPEDNSILSGPVLDNMEAYTNNTLARAAWVTDVTTLVPSTLGTGEDGDVTISADTTITSPMNYSNLTIDAGYTLTATGLPIYCVGTVTVNGTLICGAIYANVVTVGAAGNIKYCSTIKANTINNAGSLSANVREDATWSRTIDGSCYQPDSYTGNATGATSVRVAAPQGPAGTGTQTGTWIFSSVNVGSISTGAYSSTGSAPGGSGTGKIELQIAGVWTEATSGDNVTGVRLTVTANVPSLGVWDTYYAGPLVINQVPSCYYINSTGTVPTSGATGDFVRALDVFSSTAKVNQAVYSLKAVCAEGADTLDGIIAKTLPQNFDLTSNGEILIDVWSLRAGTNIKFGMGNESDGAVTDWFDIEVVDDQSWTTHVIDVSGMADKSEIRYIAFKFIDTDDPNVVYFDNIRPSAYNGGAGCSYLSQRFTINAQTMGDLYWNELLTAYGDVVFYTRTSNSESAFTNWTDDTGWSAALTDPSGSAITSSPYVYFQFKVVLTSTDDTGINFPYIYKATGYNIKFTYWKVKNTAEQSVEFIYRTGWRNFDQPFDDKIYRKLITLHESESATGGGGYFKAIVECDEQDTQSTEDITPVSPFTSISLDDYPKRWYTTLPDNMYGKELRLTIYKNDTYDYRLRQYGVFIEDIPLI